jgi:hypothetical protein
MTEDAFWQLIELARRSVSEPKDVPKWLVEHLEKNPSAEIFDFARNVRVATAKAYDFRLWAAATAILDGSCGDDAFQDFCSWLIGQGREVFERAIDDPDSLADLEDFSGADGFSFPNSVATVGYDAYEAKTGRADFSDHLSEADFGMGDLKNQEAWDGELESLPQVVPRLYKRFLANKKFGEFE